MTGFACQGNKGFLRTYPKNRNPLIYIQKTCGFLYINKWDLVFSSLQAL
jgi:hypothetical protein